jgi:hypothetical protein
VGTTGRGGGGHLAKLDGTFELWRLDPGTYTLAAQQSSGEQTLQTAPVEIEVAGSNIDRVELRAVPPFDVSGVVQYEDEQAKPQPPQPQSQSQPQQTRSPRAGPPHLMLTTINTRMFGGSRQNVSIETDGSFSLRQLAPGSYRVELSWNTAYVKSLQLGPVQMPGRTLDLRSGSGGAQITVIVSSAVAEVSGVVRNADDPAPGKFVVLAADPSDGGRPYFANSAPDGSYRMANVAPGKYKLALVDRLDQAVMSGRLDDSEDPLEITISPGDKLTKDLKVRTDSK